MVAPVVFVENLCVAEVMQEAANNQGFFVQVFSLGDLPANVGPPAGYAQTVFLVLGTVCKKALRLNWSLRNAIVPLDVCSHVSIAPFWF